MGRTRKRADKPRTGMSIKVTDEERKQITDAAAIVVLAPSSFVANAAIEHANTIIKSKSKPKRS
jgi:uncharacterized protein (DUF1778 family)